MRRGFWGEALVRRRSAGHLRDDCAIPLDDTPNIAVRFAAGTALDAPYPPDAVP